MRRPRRAGLTLRARLTLALIAVLLAAFAATGVAVTVLLRHYLIDRLDTQLRSAGVRLSANLDHDRAATGGAAGGILAGQSVGTLSARIDGARVTDATVVAGDGRDQAPPLTGADRSALVAADAGATTVGLDRLGDYRVRAVEARDGQVRLVGLPLRPVEDVVRRLIAILLALFSVATLVSAAAAAVIVGRELRPLRRVAVTARHVSNLPLTQEATQLPDRIAPAAPRTEVDQVSAAFDRMLDHVRQALADRDRTEAQLRRFVADASHELRTPLATIRGYSELATRTDDPLPELTATALTRIAAAATRMATLVEDLLLLARLDSGRPLARVEVDLSQIVLEVVADARAAAPEHHWRLDLPETPVEVAGDPARLYQVLANLVANAHLHTPAGTTIVTTARCADQLASVEVCDDGPGVPEELGARVFDRFTRADDARVRGRGSSGLGLAIARGIAEAHGGALTVASRPGRTAFSLSLPREDAPNAAEDARPT